MIKKAKQVCWQKFLQGQDTFQEALIDNKNWCRTMLQYTKTEQFKTTPALKDI